VKEDKVLQDGGRHRIVGGTVLLQLNSLPIQNNGKPGAGSNWTEKLLTPKTYKKKSG